MDLTERVIEKEYFQKLKSRVNHNYQIADFYFGMYEETRKDNFLNKSRAIDLCCKWWDIDFYQLLKVKDIKRVNLCKDKFCLNCQSMIAQKRQQKYAPVLDELRKDYEVYHMVVTVPNCEAEELLPLLNRIYKKFRFLMRYFSGERKVRGIDFMQYGYGGAVRGLEVTQNEATKQFHPHFHTMILLRKGLKLEYKHINQFSYDKGKLTCKFSDLEILLQKIWYLLMNDKRVILKAIEELKLGYDIHISDSEGHYHECFKYACKGAFKDDDGGGFLYNEQTFRTLYQALYKRHMIQGYGLLYNFEDLDGDILEDEIIDEYERIIASLKDFEKPIFRVEGLDAVIESCINSCMYISKSNIRRYLLERREEIISKHLLIADCLDDFFSQPVKEVLEQTSILENKEVHKNERAFTIRKKRTFNGNK